MNESFVLLVLALGLTLGSSNGENLENNDKVESNPAMSCLLFGNEACNIGCAITGQLFNKQSHGVCDSDQFCTCQSKGKTAFRDLWKERFNSETVFDNIRRSKLVYTNVFGIFRSNMFKTNEELKESLESAISPYQISTLETNDQYPAAKYTKDGKFDKEALQKYVREKLDEELKSKSARALLDVKYKEIFKKALETYKPSKASMFNYTFKVKQLKNKQLDIMLEEFFKENNMKKSKIEIPTDHEPINRIVSNIVVNELINRIEGESDVEIDRDINPSISCLLFGNDVCNDVCVYYANLKNFQSSGICDSEDICTCYNHKDRKIDESQRPAVERTDNGKFDEKALVKYVTDNVDKKLKSESGKSLLDVKYKEQFAKALEKSKDEKDFAPEYNFKLTQLKNKTLDSMFDKFLEENKMKRPDTTITDIPDDIYTILLVDNIIVNTIIDRIDGNHNVEIDKDESPSMSCILFGKEVCNGICVLNGRLMNFQSSGDCDSDNRCTCYNQKDTEVSDSQRISINRTKDGNFDEKALVKYVRENVDRKLKSELGETLLNIKYKDRFWKAMENSKDEDNFLDDYNFRVTLLKNQILENMFNEFLKKNNMKKSDAVSMVLHEDYWAISQVDKTIINTLIDRIERKNKASQKSSMAKGKNSRVPCSSAAGVRKKVVKS